MREEAIAVQLIKRLNEGFLRLYGELFRAAVAVHRASGLLPPTPPLPKPRL